MALSAVSTSGCQSISTTDGALFMTSLLIGFRVPILVGGVAGALSFNIKRGGLLYGKVEDGKVKVSARSVAK